MTEEGLERHMAVAVLERDRAAARALRDLLTEMDGREDPFRLVAFDKYPEVERYVACLIRLTEDQQATRHLTFRAVHKKTKNWDTEQLIALRYALAEQYPRISSVSGSWFMTTALYDLWRLWEPGMGVYAAKLLSRSGLVTPEAIHGVGRRGIAKQRGCGKETLKSVEKMLARYGLAWRSEE